MRVPGREKLVEEARSFARETVVTGVLQQRIQIKDMKLREARCRF